jgi:hypothetical protein
MTDQPAPSDSTDDTSTGLRWLPTWRGVYAVVLGVFVLVVLVMWGFEACYS